MEYFKSWIISICGACIITAIFKIIVSDSNVKKSVNIFLSMFVFLYTIIPIGDVFSNINFNLENNIETKTYKETYENGYETILIKSIENICEKYDCKINYINVDSYIDNDGYLVVNKIELQLNNSEKNDLVKKELKEKLYYEVIFI